jgi:integrase
VRFRKPFYRASRKLWYVQLNGRQINLGPDKAEAFRRYHELMAAPEAPKPTGDLPAVVVIDHFLDWCQRHRAKRTYDWYLDYLQSFARTLPRGIATSKLRPFHVQQWVDAQPGWKTGKRGAITAVQRAFNWAEKMGHIDKSPLRHVEKPAAGRLEQVVTEAEYHAILALAKDQEFRDLLTAAWQTGARPHELLTVEARHFDPVNRCWAFPPDEAKGKKRWRVIHLTDAAYAMSVRLTVKHTDGPLFRNTDGIPWNPFSLNCRWGRIKKKLGKKYSLYSLRHSYCTDALVKGLDAVTVSVLMGHRDTVMISRVYSHLTERTDHLKRAASKVRA